MYSETSWISLIKKIISIKMIIIVVLFVVGIASTNLLGRDNFVEESIENYLLENYKVQVEFSYDEDEEDEQLVGKENEFTDLKTDNNRQKK